MRKVLLPAFALIGFALAVPARPALAVSKEIVQLQTQIQTLQDTLGALQRSNAEQMGVLQHLVEQSSDNINRINQQMTSLQAKLDAEGQNTQLSGQIQSLNDSVDELKTRLGRIDSTLTSMQGQMQNVSAPPAGTASAALSPGASGGAVSPGAPGSGSSAPQGGQPQAPPVDELYQSAVRDYNGAKYDLATSEFSDVTKYYPQSEQAGSANFYLGEVAYRQGLYPAAIRYYDTVLEQFSGSPKAPAAQLRKGEAELASSQRDAGVRDLRALVQRYPTSPEGTQARSLLNGMGVRLTASKPSPVRAQ